MEKNENKERSYICRRKDDTVIIVQIGDCGLEIPILGGLLHPDGVLLVDTALPVPSYILRECLDELERVMPPEGGEKEGEA